MACRAISVNSVLGRTPEEVKHLNNTETKNRMKTLMSMPEEETRKLATEKTKELDESIHRSGEEERMGKENAYRNFHNLAYKKVLGMIAKQYRDIHGLKPGTDIRPFLIKEELCKVIITEEHIKELVDEGLIYTAIKDIILSEKDLFAEAA